jgi:hypothetical protein
MRYRLRTLLIVLALGPPVLAGAWWAINRGWLQFTLPALLVIAFPFGLAYVASRFASLVTKH